VEKDIRTRGRKKKEDRSDDIYFIFRVASTSASTLILPIPTFPSFLSVHEFAHECTTKMPQNTNKKDRNLVVVCWTLDLRDIFSFLRHKCTRDLDLLGKESM
jgi:hypothetical protein